MSYSENEQLIYTLYKRGENGYEPYSGSDLKLNVSYGHSSIERYFSGGSAQFYPWCYEVHKADHTHNHLIQDEKQNTIASVVIETEKDEITQLTITPAEGVTDSFIELASLIQQHNGVRYAEQKAVTANQKLVVSAIKTLLESLRDRPGTLQTEISGFNTHLPHGNYKLMVQLQASGVVVAEDFFVFNVNRNQENLVFKAPRQTQP